MRITPLDVRKQEFRKGMRGLDPEEVYAFLSTVADEYESVLNDNKALRERLLELDDKVQEYRSMERTLRDTLLTAERVNAEAKDNARREANIIIKEAQIEAERALRDIKTEAMKLRQQVQQLRSQRDAYLARMKVVAESHLSTVVSAAADFKKEDDAVGDYGEIETSLADQPVDREVQASQRPGNLFQAPARPVAEETVQPRQPVTQPVTPPATPRQAPAAPVQPNDKAPVSTPPVDERRAPVPESRAGLSAGGVDPISVIIDRMKKGQQEILAAGAGSYGIAENPRTVAPEPAGSTTALAADDGARDDTDVTSEFNLDEIRRELAAEERGER